MITGEKPPDKSPPVKSYVSLGFTPRASHRGASFQGAFHLEQKMYIFSCILLEFLEFF